jgi:hypothetical protein
MHVRTGRSLAMTWSKKLYDFYSSAVNDGSKKIMLLSFVGRYIDGQPHLKSKVLKSPTRIALIIKIF